MIDDGNTRDEFAPEESMSIDEMPDVQDDETLRDVVAALGALPPVSEADVQRIVSRAAAQAAETGRRGAHRWTSTWSSREAREGDVASLHARPQWLRAMPIAAAAALVLAAGIGGFLLRGVTARDGASGTAAVASADPPAPTGMELTPVAAAPNAEMPIQTQFVLDATAASRVSLVGAFNGWDATATPLVRDAGTGLWTVTLPLAPGRHVYAFMVDDTVLTLDPRAPSTQDPELGTRGSVVLVGAH